MPRVATTGRVQASGRGQASGRTAATGRRRDVWYDPGGTFTIIAAYQAKGAASLAASYINIANPGTLNAAPGVAPTWAAATGWTFNGTTQYLVTGIVPASLNYSLIVQFTGYTSSVRRYFIGCSDGGSTALYIRREIDATNQITYSAGTVSARTPVITAGNLAIANLQPYRNGIADGPPTTGGTPPTVSDIYIGALNFLGTPSNFGLGTIIAAAIYTTLSAEQVAVIARNMAAL